jgi:hypothetical protein
VIDAIAIDEGMIFDGITPIDENGLFEIEGFDCAGV